MNLLPNQADKHCKPPIIPGLYADPAILTYQDKYYLYPTTDGFAGWSGSQFHVFSSPDLTNWTDEGIILDLATEDVPWAIGWAWAPAIYERNGKFYYYFCGKNKDNSSCIGAAVSDYPNRGFKALLKPMLTMAMMAEAGIKMSQTIDPAVYAEDGNVYLLFGNGEPAIVQLTDDLCHIKPETLRNLQGAVDFREAIEVFKKDGRYHFTWSCDDTGSEDYHVNYGISDDLYGPIEFKYTILKKDVEKDIKGTGHHCILIDGGNYYIAYHRHATPTKDYPEGKGYHRELCLAPLRFTGKLISPA